MSFGDFTLHKPRTATEACELGLRYGKGAAFLAGGTDLLVDLRSGRKVVPHVISLGDLPELREIRRDGDHLSIGALAILADVAASPEVQEFFPALGEAIGSMAGRQIRNLATLGGNFACGVPCSDTPPILCAAGADLVIMGTEGERTVAARDFVLAPRITVLKPGEIVREIRIPVQPVNSGASFQRFTLRRGSALAVASVSGWVRLEKNAIAEARIVMGAVGPVPLFAERAAGELAGKKPSPKLFATAGRIAAEEAQPISDLRGSEHYRRDIVAVLTARALAAAVERARSGTDDGGAA